MQKQPVRIEIAARLPLKENPDHDQRDHHRVRAHRFRGDAESADALFVEIDFGHRAVLWAPCPVAQAITASAVACSRLNSPVRCPSCSTTMRSDNPRISGSSDETSTIANPSEASRVIC